MRTYVAHTPARSPTCTCTSAYTYVYMYVSVRVYTCRHTTAMILLCIHVRVNILRPWYCRALMTLPLLYVITLLWLSWLWQCCDIAITLLLHVHVGGCDMSWICHKLHVLPPSAFSAVLPAEQQVGVLLEVMDDVAAPQLLLLGWLLAHMRRIAYRVRPPSTRVAWLM